MYGIGVFFSRIELAMTLGRPILSVSLLVAGLAVIAPALLMDGWNCSVGRLCVMSAAIMAPPLIGMGMVRWCTDVGSLPDSCRESAGLLLFCLMGDALFEISCQVWTVGHHGQGSVLPHILASLVEESVLTTGRLAAVMAIAGAAATFPCAWFAVAAKSRYYGYVASLRMIVTALSIFMLLQRCGELILSRLVTVLL